MWERRSLDLCPKCGTLTTVLQASILPRGRSELDGLHTQNNANIYNEAFESTLSITSISRIIALKAVIRPCHLGLKFLAEAVFCVPNLPIDQCAKELRSVSNKLVRKHQLGCGTIALTSMRSCQCPRTPLERRRNYQVISIL
jgi:hypothetical protein